MSDFETGDRVAWDWGNGTGEGRIAKRFTSRVTITIAGTEVTRNASDEEPAYLIEQEDGGEVLKSASEIGKA